MCESCPKDMDVKRNDDSKEKLYKELVELGADAEAFRMVDPTIDQLATLVRGLRRAKICVDIHEELLLRINRDTFMS
jgi:hypothetical protein